MSDNKAPRQVEVTLIKPHTHAGKKYAAGAKIKVTEPEQAFLQRKAIIAKTEVRK